jgi:ADP-ribosylglycohydrolase
MLGAIAGDVIGSVYEARPIKTTRFPLFSPRSEFTDDTVLTVAVAHAILEAEDFEDAVRKAISLGGDGDTMACIAGAIARAFFKEMPPEIVTNTRQRLPGEFLAVIDRFTQLYGE